MVAALALTSIIFFVVVGIVGISDIGETAIGTEGTLTFAANATMWYTAASMGSIPFTLMIVLLALVALAILVVCMIPKQSVT